MQSLVSYPSRGAYGKSNYRGNCSGHLIADLIDHFQPTTFVDATMGSGTTRDVCQEKGVLYKGLDIHTGFDVVKHSIRSFIKRDADMVFSHPPYHDMIDYEAERKKHQLPTMVANDLSACASYEEFLEKSQVMLFNQREATKKGGVYTTLIGDYRKKGVFHSTQSDYIQLMPKDELISVVIKAQHNTQSSFRTYRSGSFVPIMHEYLLIWKRKEATIYQVLRTKLEEYKQTIKGTWRSVVRVALMNLNGTANLSAIYEEVLKIAEDKVRNNHHFQAKIRQTLQRYFSQVDRGVWSLS